MSETIKNEIEDLITRIESLGLNWELSRKGRNLDGSWQYWCDVWHPAKLRPVAMIGPAGSPAVALALALAEVEEVAKGEG